MMEKPTKNKKNLFRIFALSGVVLLASCGSYSKAITISAAKGILDSAVAYSTNAEMDGKSYQMHSEVLINKVDAFITTNYYSIVTDVTYYFDILASDAWTTWKVTYNKVSKTSPDADAATANYVVTRDSTGNNHYVSDNGAAFRDYNAVKDSFLANFFHLPDDIIRQDSLISAKYAESLLASVGTAGDGLNNTLTSYSTLSSGGNDLSVDFKGEDFDFGTLFTEESVNLISATSFSAHFNGNLVNIMEAGYDFSYDSDSSSVTSTPASSLSSGNYEFSVLVTFGT
jgi:hypothetical protein